MQKFDEKEEFEGEYCENDQTYSGQRIHKKRLQKLKEKKKEKNKKFVSKNKQHAKSYEQPSFTIGDKNFQKKKIFCKKGHEMKIYYYG